MSVFECPTCGRVFDTRRGLGVHHSHAHGEQLPNRTCDHCGTEFYCDYERRYCSEKCHDEAVSFEGDANPNYRGGKESTECVLCETEFSYYPSEKEGLYCPECVENAPWRDPPVVTGSDHPRWNGGKLTVNCDMCGTSVERHPNQLAGEATLCSRECHSNWLSDAFTGEGHPNWRGGGSENYGKGWARVRKVALERDGYACVLCGTDTNDLGRNPDVHHVIPVRLFVESPVLAKTDAHTLDNVVTLCPTCHRRADFGHYSREELRWRAASWRVPGAARVEVPSPAAV